MGCDIHSYVEVRGPDGKWAVVSSKFEPFRDRNYGVFAFLTGTVRNYSGIPGIVPAPRTSRELY